MNGLLLLPTDTQICPGGCGPTMTFTDRAYRARMRSAWFGGAVTAVGVLLMIGAGGYLLMSYMQPPHTPRAR